MRASTAPGPGRPGSASTAHGAVTVSGTDILNPPRPACGSAATPPASMACGLAYRTPFSPSHALPLSTTTRTSPSPLRSRTVFAGSRSPPGRNRRTLCRSASTPIAPPGSPPPPPGPPPRRRPQRGLRPRARRRAGQPLRGGRPRACHPRPVAGAATGPPRQGVRPGRGVTRGLVPGPAGGTPGRDGQRRGPAGQPTGRAVGVGLDLRGPRPPQLPDVILTVVGDHHAGPVVRPVEVVQPGQRHDRLRPGTAVPIGQPHLKRHEQPVDPGDAEIPHRPARGVPHPGVGEG